jgi:hypothetical protein
MDHQHDRKDQPLPGSVSDQNAEEAEPGHGGGEEAEPRRGEEPRRQHGGGDPGSGGEAGEGSQSTGNPDSAG